MPEIESFSFLLSLFSAILLPKFPSFPPDNPRTNAYTYFSYSISKCLIFLINQGDLHNYLIKFPNFTKLHLDSYIEVTSLKLQPVQLNLTPTSLIDS